MREETGAEPKHVGTGNDAHRNEGRGFGRDGDPPNKKEKNLKKINLITQAAWYTTANRSAWGNQ